jgi:hypothetical protein
VYSRYCIISIYLEFLPLFFQTASHVLLTQVPNDFSSTIQAWTSKINSLLAPAGPGYFHYCSVQGQPVLLGMRLGQLSAEHFAAMFMQQHAPGKPAAAERRCNAAVSACVLCF